MEVLFQDIPTLIIMKTGIGVNITSINDVADESNETFKFEIKQQGTNGSSNNFVSTSSPVFNDTYYAATNDYFIQRCI